MNDAEFRRIARAAQEASVESVDVAGDLREVRRRIAAGEDGNRVTGFPAAESKPRVRRLALVAGLAAAALFAAVVAVNLNDDPTIQTTTPEPASTGVTTTSATSSSVATSTEVPATAVPSTSIAVDATNPPALIEPIPLVALPLAPNPNGNSISVAIGEREIVVRQPATSEVTLIDYRTEATDSPPVRSLALAEPLSSIVLGPGDVLYGFGDVAPPVGGSAMPEALRYVAIALSGAREGEVIAENRLDVNTYLELPWGPFGHGPDGVIDRLRNLNEVVAGYVDANGDPTEWTGPTPVPLTSIGDLTANPLTVDTLDGATSWTLAISRAPGNARDFVGPNPPAPTSGGRVVYYDRIGANLTGGDFGPSAMPVVAILEPDGSGSWVRLPDDWSVVASDVWGTVLMRTTETSLELALLDDALPGSTEAAESDTLAVGYRCETDITCTQVAETSDGLVVYDPIAETLTLLDSTGRSLLDEIPMRQPLAEPIAGPVGNTQPALVAVGPDDIVYFTVWPSAVNDPIRDLVAVPTNGPDAGSVITVAEGLDGSGDSDLVPTSSGLAVVGCCGNDSVRPSADAQIFEWIGSDGQPVSSGAVYFEMGLGDLAALRRIDPASDIPPIELELPGVAIGTRGMPQVVATDHGGALMQVFDWFTNRRYLARLGPNDTLGARDAADIVVVPNDTTATGEPLLLESGGTIVARIGDRLVRRTMEQLGTPGWTGRLTTDLSGDVWTTAAPGLNVEIDARQPEWASDPLLLARQLVPRLGPAEQFDATWDPEQLTLTVTVSNLLDDSAFAVPRAFEFEQADDGLYRVVDGLYAVQCQPNRGHQDFQPRACT